MGQDSLTGPGQPLRVMADTGQLTSLILWGPAGTGKTTLARLLAATAEFAMETLSAVSSGVKDLREVIAAAGDRLGTSGQRTVLFIDEVHRFNKAQQDLLLPATETGQIVLIGATTENPYFEVNAALISRTTQWRLRPLDARAIASLVARGLAVRDAEIDEDALATLVAVADGDGRAALTTLDVALALAAGRDDTRRVTHGDVVTARDGRAHHQSADTHYDQVSALIKSVRGSDPDAALFWLSALLDAGESARFIARRLVILASEDVGLADPMGLVLAESAARAIELVGLPEAQLTLAHATVALCLMDKSNSAMTALGRAHDAIENGASTVVPAHIADASYTAARTQLGHGLTYEYPHEHPEGWVQQQYLPDGVDGDFYRPSDRARERALVEKWRARQSRTGDDTEPSVG